MSAGALPLPVLISLVWGAGSLAVAYLSAYALSWSGLYAWLNQAGPAITLLGCLAVAYGLVRRNAAAVWSPVPWFLVACAAYYGFGPLSYYYASPETVAYMQLDFPLDERQILLTNLLNSVGLAVVGLGVILGHAFFAVADNAPPEESDRQMIAAVWLFLIVGGFVKYVFALPHALGLLAYVLPGSIQHLSALLNGAIILLINQIHRGRRQYQWLLYPLVLSEFVSGLMTFSKTEVMTTGLAIVLGVYLSRPRLRVLVLAGIASVLLYATVLAPFVIFARNHFSESGVSEVADLQATVETYSRVGGEAQALVLPEVQLWWARLNYAPDQGFAMDAYERGTTGQTVNLLPYIFVPRLLYPDKPSMNSGREFTELLTGQEATSSTALGLFGETYWNGGWVLMVAVCLYVGFLFTLFTRFGIAVIARGQLIYVPIVFGGIMTGLYPDGWVVSTFFGGVLEIFALYLLLALFRAVIAGWPSVNQRSVPAPTAF